MPPIFQQLDKTARRPYSTQEYIKRISWNWARAIFIRPSPRPANAWRRFWARLFGATIDSSSGFKSSTLIFHPWLLKIGRHCTLAEGVTVYNLGPITIGDHTVISQNAYLCAGTHDYTQPTLPLRRPAIVIGSGVWICSGAFIGPGVIIGDNSIVGARAVVTKDVPPGVIVGGNPARVIKPRPMG